MDLSKAFDMVEWLALFEVLQAKNVSPVFLRTLLYVYSNQSCAVKWNGSISNKFSVTNGVRQGAVSSPILFSIYIDELFSLLRSSNLGSTTSSMDVLDMQMIFSCCQLAGLGCSSWSITVHSS